jgi:2-hydroxycyclohexanecarboxyl-CoA dehydrogenase
MSIPNLPGDRPVALVTGSASGIGAAVSRLLAGSGWIVGGIDRVPTARSAAGVAHSATAEVADPSQVDAAVEHLTAILGPPRALVTAAGHYEQCPFSAIDEVRWQRMLDVHLGGAVHAIRAVLPAMQASGGAIVAVSSELAIGGGDEDAHYAAAKGSLLGLVRSLAVELAPAGIRVNALAPGPTDTPLLAHDSPWREPDYLASLPSRRLAEPIEIALAAQFLIEEATFTTGEVLSVNSGAVL